MADTVNIDDLKTMLQIDDTSQDGLLKIIIEQTVAQTRFKLGLKKENAFPDELTYIPFQVCIRRYNRLKNEGMESYSQEGESIKFRDDDFSDFVEDIEAYAQAGAEGVAKAQFINPYATKGGA